jgi:uncharacterized integral membrane protein
VNVKLVHWLITVSLAIVIVIFALNNRTPVEVDLFPFGLVIAWPLFVFVFLGMGIGAVIGLIMAWISSHPARKTSRERKTRIRELERQVETLQSSADSSTQLTPIRPPALPE